MDGKLADKLHAEGVPLTEIRDRLWNTVPWTDFDPKCKGVDGFWPMYPHEWALRDYNIASLLKTLKFEEEVQSDPEISDMFKREKRKHAEVHRSQIAQLRGAPGAIPEAAGQQYREWVVYLRSQDKTVE